MLLRELNVTNSRGSLLGLPLEEPLGGFVVKDIEGLQPVKATLVSSSFANMDGEQYHSSRREARDIKIKLGLQPDYGVQSVKNLRDQLYKYFMPKTEIKMQFKMYDKFAESVLDQFFMLEITGRIEDFESPLFSRDPEVDINIRCFDPDFVNPIPVIFEAETAADLTEVEHEYIGNAETGIVFTIRPDRAIADFTIYHRPPDETLRTVYFTYPLLAGDVLRISSIFGAKSVLLTRAGVESSILYAQSPQSNWLELSEGVNKFRVHTAGAPIPYDIEYTTKYGGL